MKLWRVEGLSKGGNQVRIVVRAADYFEARAKGRKVGMIIHTIALIEKEPVR